MENNEFKCLAAHVYSTGLCDVTSANNFISVHLQPSDNIYCKTTQRKTLLWNEYGELVHFDIFEVALYGSKLTLSLIFQILEVKLCFNQRCVWIHVWITHRQQMCFAQQQLN